MNSRRNQRTESTSDVWRGYIFDWTGAFSTSFLISPIYAFDSSREVQINTGIKGRIAVIVLA
jgi:hypothetical protein